MVGWMFVCDCSCSLFPSAYWSINTNFYLQSSRHLSSHLSTFHWHLVSNLYWTDWWREGILWMLGYQKWVTTILSSSFSCRKTWLKMSICLNCRPLENATVIENYSNRVLISFTMPESPSIIIPFNLFHISHFPLSEFCNNPQSHTPSI